MSRTKTSSRWRLYVLLPASLAVGLVASEFSRGVPQEENHWRSDAAQARSAQGRAEWFVGRSAAMAISHSPSVERTN